MSHNSLLLYAIPLLSRCRCRRGKWNLYAVVDSKIDNRHELEYMDLYECKIHCNVLLFMKHYTNIIFTQNSR